MTAIFKGLLLAVMVIVSGHDAVAGGVVVSRYDGWKAADTGQAPAGESQEDAPRVEKREAPNTVEGGYRATYNYLKKLRNDAESALEDVCESIMIPFAPTGVRELFPGLSATHSQAIAARYPGSDVECVGKNGKLVLGNRQLVFNHGRIVRLINPEGNGITYTIGFTTMDSYMVHISDDKQYLSMIVNQDPGKTYFNDASLNITASAGLAVKRDGNVAVNITKNELVGEINKLYSEVQHQGDMFRFANNLLLYPDFREYLISNINQGGKK